MISVNFLLIGEEKQGLFFLFYLSLVSFFMRERKDFCFLEAQETDAVVHSIKSQSGVEKPDNCTALIAGFWCF